MHNELTKQDLKMMREELDYRRITLRPKLLEAVKEARAFGDLSENFDFLSLRSLCMGQTKSTFSVLVLWSWLLD